MKVLMIGGTGTISMAITRLLCQSGWEVYLLNRGSRRAEAPAGRSAALHIPRVILLASSFSNGWPRWNQSQASGKTAPCPAPP